MITLPGVNPGVKATAVQGKSGAAQTDAAVDAIGQIDGADGAESNETGGFVALLGSKLQSLTKQSGKAELTTEKAADAGQSAKEKLNALLAAQEKATVSGALIAAPTLKGEAKAGEETNDAQQDQPVSLSDSDRQTMQALFAMLPPAVTQPPAAATPKSAEALTAAVQDKAGRPGVLTTMLTGGAVGGEAKKAGDKADSALTGTLTQAPSQHAADDAAPLPAAFQQVLSSATKASDKESSAAAPGTTISNTLLGAATTAVTPAAVSPFAATAAAQPLSSPLGSHEWQQALGQQILMFSRNGQQSAELHLHPQDLGSIQISLKLDNDQAQLNMVSGHSQVRAALEAALPQLRTALAENGISLGQSNVSSDAFQQGPSFGGQQQQHQRSSGNTFSLTPDNDGDVTPLAVPASLQARASGNGGVDIFA